MRTDCAAPEFDGECQPSTGVCESGTRFVPVTLVDVAGLVPGAHEGRGLGNQFLRDLNGADVLIHVVGFSGTTDREGEVTTDHGPREEVDILDFVPVSEHAETALKRATAADAVLDHRDVLEVVSTNQ